MKNIFNLCIIGILFCVFSLSAQEIKSPSQFLGYELGTRFSRHHQVVAYFNYVSKNSSSMKLEQYGETNEHKPLYVSYISSEENIVNLEQIRKNNLQITGILEGDNLSNNIVVIVWLSYNVHGNESSSTEAAMVTLYELITKRQDWLKNTVVIIDPCLNPDGRDRYVNGYNQIKSTPFNYAQDAKEHRESWPGGRANHYLFDLNRDWAWATQIETQARLKVYNKWMPHIHVDFHEQGINCPYYFAPAAEPFHEIITDWQREFQIEIGKNHAKYFDKNSWLYFTKESFDLLYPSYGDTYPTYMGAIGMTYEQAGSGFAGLGVKTDENEVLTLINRIEHHKTTGLSTVEIASKNAKKLVGEFEKYFQNNDGITYKSYVLKNSNQDNTNRLLALLDRHEIKYGSPKTNSVSGFNYKTQKQGNFKLTTNDIVINTNQPKGKMVKALFEPKTKLTDSLTYDITAWSIPYAYGFDAIASKSIVGSIDYSSKNITSNSINKKAYAYIAEWNSLKDAEFLGSLLQNNIHVRSTEKPFTINNISYKSGTLVILRNDNKKNSNFDTKLIEIANNLNRKLASVKTGFVDSGVDFGSGSVKLINKQQVAVLSGKGISSLGFGEIWHYFETQLHYPLTVLDTDYFSKINLNNYDVLILPSGSYSKILTESKLKELKSWIKGGGTLIAIDGALKSFANKKGFELKSKKEEKDSLTPNMTPYNMRRRKSAENLITGSIFKSSVDFTHPLAFGYSDSYYTLKRNKNSYAYLKSGGNVAYLPKNSRAIAGFSGSKTFDLISESLLFGVENSGSGSIIYMVDNPLFRSFWENGKLFFTNAIFMVNSNEFRK